MTANICGDLNEAVDAIPQAVIDFEEIAALLKDCADSHGISGASGRVISELLTKESLRAAKCADALRPGTEHTDTSASMNSSLEKAKSAVIKAGTFGYAFRPVLALFEKHRARTCREKEAAAGEALHSLGTKLSAVSTTLRTLVDDIEPPDRSPFYDRFELDKPNFILPWRLGPGEGPQIPGTDTYLGDSGSWDQPTTPVDQTPPGGVATDNGGGAGVGAGAGLIAGLGKGGGGTGSSDPIPGVGGSGGSSGGAGTTGIGAGSRVSADSASTVSRLSLGSGGSSLNGGLASGRSGLSGLGSGAGGLGGAGSGVSGIGGVGSAGAGRAAGTGSAGAGGAAGGQGMMMGGGGGGAGGDKDKSRGSLGYRAPKIEAAARGRVRAPTGDAGSRADFPESQPQSEPRN